MLEKIFTSKTRIKIIQYLFFEKPKTYIREISKNLEIPVSSVKREVDNLRNFGLIADDEKVLLNKKFIILDDLKNIFIKTDYIRYPIQNALKKMDIDFIILFGSFAKGDYSADSDVDLLIVGQTSQSEIFKKLKRINKIIKRDVNPVVWSSSDLKKKEKNWVCQGHCEREGRVY